MHERCVVFRRFLAVREACAGMSSVPKIALREGAIIHWTLFLAANVCFAYFTSASISLC